MQKKMADFEPGQLQIGLEFVRWTFTERNNFSEGSSETKNDAQVIRVRGAAAPRVFNSNYLFISQFMIITIITVLLLLISLFSL